MPSTGTSDDCISRVWRRSTATREKHETTKGSITLWSNTGTKSSVAVGLSVDHEREKERRKRFAFTRARTWWLER